MELRQLRYFAAIVEHGSLTKASQYVHVAQPALSQQIAALEAELRTPVFVRGPRGVTLTEAGRLLYERATKVLDEVERARADILYPSQRHMLTVAVGLTPSTMSVLGLPLLKRVKDMDAQMRLELTLGTSQTVGELLADGHLDLCVNYREIGPSDDGSRVILDEAFLVIGPVPGLGSEETCPISALDGVPLVLPGKRTAVRALLDRVFAVESVEMNVVADIDLTTCIAAVAADGLASTVLPWSALPPGFAESHVVRTLVSDTAAERPVSISFSRALPRTSAVVDVAAVLASAMEDLVNQGEWRGARLRGST